MQQDDQWTLIGPRLDHMQADAVRLDIGVSISFGRRIFSWIHVDYFTIA
jgi:hypothetical protein